MNSPVRVTAKLVRDTQNRGVEKLRKLLDFDRRTVNVGFPSGGPIHDDSDLPVAAIAAIHEFGAPGAGIPERPFLIPSVRKNSPKYSELAGKALKAVMRQKLNINQALGLLGEQAKADVQEEIKNGTFEPLKPATIARKGSSKPLIDTGQMRQSVQWEFGDD